VTVARTAVRKSAQPAATAATPAEQQMAEGREARQRCPRSSHAPGRRVKYDRDAVKLLIESNQDRLPELIPVRHSRMLESPFAFFRGSAVIQAHDLAKTPRSGIDVQACGDCHLLNFGGFATPERNLIFDINDFDETHPGPWEWDVKRLAVSLVLAARWRELSAATATAIATATVARYRKAMRDYAGLSTLDTWYARIDFSDVAQQVRDSPKLAKQLATTVKVARSHTAEHTFHKLTRDDHGTPRIVDQPPLLFHPQGPEEGHKLTARKFLKDYSKTLREEYQRLMARFRVIDAAIKVVGVGSVGTRCFIALMLGERGDPLFLQVKEARRSVIARHVAKSPWTNQGQRVVTGQRLMQAVSDIFLGWARGPGGRDFYVRQLRDMKCAADLTKYNADMLARYGELCGRTLARAHAKSGSAAAISGYLGASATFDGAIARYAVAYADQVERDYAAFQAAARRGRIKTETTPGPIGELIR
jgi:uncharacterized protein (DUF2252 family)